MPFENQLNIDVRAFFFNAETDYLPYYKNFSFTLQKETILKDVLALVKEKNPDFSYPEKNLLFRVNDLIVTGDENVAKVVKQMGSKLTITPALEYRSDNGLVLNNHEFMHQYRKVFERHNETKENLAYYLTLYPLHYASETFKYNHEYIGDAILILAHKIISDGSEFKDEILHAINDEFNGIRCCEYENNIYNGEDYGVKIAELKEMINLTSKPTLVDKLSALTLRKKSHEVEEESLENLDIALYIGNKNSNELVEKVKNEVQQAGGNFVTFEMSTKLAGQTIMNSHPKLAHLKAGTMFLNALDSGADILICADNSDVEIFQAAISQCERELGRDIELKIISMSTYQNLLTNKSVTNDA